MKNLLKPKEVAEIFKVSTEQVYNWIRGKKIKSINTPGGGIRILESEVRKFLKENSIRGTGRPSSPRKRRRSSNAPSASRRG